MKIGYISDLHLEFYDYDLGDVSGDVLILAGDITTGTRIIADMNFFIECSEKFKHVVYVPGNHEFYHGSIENTVKFIKTQFKLKNLNNIHVLDTECIWIDGVKFIGTTMWSDISSAFITPSIGDFCRIRKDDLPLSIDEYYLMHRKDVSYIWHECVENCVVITHHAPSYLSVHPRFAGNDLNICFASNLDEEIKEIDKIAFWIHGHMHDPVDYMIGNTRVLSNPRGYPGENQPVEVKFFDMSIVV